MLTKFVKLTLLLLGICILSAAPVFADSTGATTTFFTFNGIADIPPSTSVGMCPNGVIGICNPGLVVHGFSAPVSGQPVFSNGVLVFKNNSPAESGLGLEGGIDNEISGSGFIELDLRNILAASPSRLTLGLSSLQGPDAYNVYVANPQPPPRLGIPFGELGTLLASNQTGTTFTITDRSFTYISITAAGPTDSVLLGCVMVDSLTSKCPFSPTVIPKPSSAGLLLIGLGALVAAGTVGKKLLT